MVVSAFNEEIICIVKDLRENAEAGKFTIVIRPQDTVQNLFNSAGTLTPLKKFELTLEKSPHNYIKLSDKLHQGVEDVGISVGSKHTIIISPQDNPFEDKNITIETEMPSDDDLALGASASPIEEEINYDTPAPPPLPPIICPTPPKINPAELQETKLTLRRYNDDDYASSSKQSFVGLVNQAMTCYLNSLLQALFMTPEFRNAMYNWEYDGNGEEKSIPYQLQKLFVNMQTSSKPAVETTDLTKSFGWDSAEGWQQHDIQELCRVMFDALEQKFKNTEQSDLINRLYEGKMIDYVKCLECQTEKQREDKFLDIPLPVRPFGSTAAYECAEDALRAFVQPETLDGNNQYFCEKCNKKCDAHKGLKFTKFPYILTLHLKRFDFDYQTFHRIKLNDKVTFPQELNLNNFINSVPQTVNGKTDHVAMDTADNFMMKCDECSTTDSGSALEEDTFHNGAASVSSTTTPNDNFGQDLDEGIEMEVNGDSHSKLSGNFNAPGPYVYELFAIMIHSGSASGGHYYAYIKDFNCDKWYSFNDQTVTPITQEDIQKSFGGAAYKAYYSAYSSSTNAYMLMYRQRDSSKNTLPIKQEEFPDHIKNLMKTMQEASDRKLKERDHELVKFKVYFTNPKTKQQKEQKIYMSDDATFSDTVVEACRLMKIKSIIPTSRCRLVAYDNTTEIIERSFDGKEEDQIGDIMGSLEKASDMLLEVRGEHETFDEYLPDGIMTKVYKLDINGQIVDGPFPIRIANSQTVLEYKSIIAKKLGMNIKQIVLALNMHKDETRILEDNDSKICDENLIQYSKIFVAINNPADPEFICKFKYLASRLDHIISLYIALPNMESETLQKLSIPKYHTSLTNGDATPIPSECNSEDSSLSDNDRTLTEDLDNDAFSALKVNGSSSSMHFSNGVTSNGINGEEEDEENENYYKDAKFNDFYCRVTAEENISLTKDLDDDTENEKMIKVLIDKRATIGFLKYKLQTQIQVPMEFFKIFKASIVQSQEITNLNEDLGSYKDGERLSIELGRALRKGEYKAKLYYLNLNEVADDTEKLPVLCNWILRNGPGVAQVKREILAHITTLDSKYMNIQYDNCRLRKKSWKTIGKIFLDDHKFGDDIILTTNFEFILQEVEDLNRVTPFHYDDICLLMRRWYPAKMSLGKYDEMVVGNKMEFKEKISELSDIPVENIEYAKIQTTTFLRDTNSVLNIHTGITWSNQSVTLETYPLNQSQDGHLYYYRDRTEPLKELTPEERKELTSKENSRSSSSYSSPRRERALKIYLDTSPAKLHD